MRTLEETIRDCERWRGKAPGSLERDALHYLEMYRYLLFHGDQEERKQRGIVINTVGSMQGKEKDGR